MAPVRRKARRRVFINILIYTETIFDVIQTLLLGVSFETLNQLIENFKAPDNARDVVCQGSYCATVCNQGEFQLSKSIKVIKNKIQNKILNYYSRVHFFNTK